MPLEVFYRGGFRTDNTRGAARTVAWDGTNEADICDWLNADIADFLAIHPIPLEGDPTPWTVAVAEGVATFVGWRGQPFNPNAVVEVAVSAGDWLAAWEWSKGPAAIDPAGMWRTTDPYGRPDDVAELFAPGTPLPWS